MKKGGGIDSLPCSLLNGLSMTFVLLKETTESEFVQTCTNQNKPLVIN